MAGQDATALYAPKATSGVAGQHVLERAMGFEPTTSTMARLHSTTELHPHILRTGMQFSEGWEARRVAGPVAARVPAL